MASQIQSLEKSKKDILDTLLTNTTKMLSNRGLLDPANLEDNIKKILSTGSVDNSVYKIKLNNNNNILIKYIPHKVASINKTSPIIEFIRSNLDTKKIIIVKEINPKSEQIVKSAYKNTEIFLEEELMINIVDNILVPKHSILSKEETDTFYDKFNCKKKDMPKIFNGDPIAKYYDMKINDVVKIERPSETSGVTNFYRLVVKGELI